MLSIYSQIVRLIVASLVGVIIGIERTKRKKSAGVGTFSIICITSCFLTLISAYGFGDGTDPSRLIANIITAIGFVAGGVIFTVNNKDKVKVNGLTTGAEIFCVASLGIGIGLGLYAIVLTVVILIQINIAIALKVKLHYKNKHFLEESINKNEDEEENEEVDI